MMRRASSEGRDAARVYVEAEVPPSRPEPPLIDERVALLDPRRTPTLRGDDPPRSAGPRHPAQQAPRCEIGPDSLPSAPRPGGGAAAPAREAGGEPSVELPEGLPLTAAQPVFVPPALAARWREEAKRGGER
jgi:hypothetical protein